MEVEPDSQKRKVEMQVRYPAEFPERELSRRVPMVDRQGLPMRVLQAGILLVRASGSRFASCERIRQPGSLKTTFG